MSTVACTVGATFLPLATQFKVWWIAVKLLSTGHSLLCYPQLYFNLTDNMLSYWRWSRLFMRYYKWCINPSYASKVYVPLCQTSVKTLLCFIAYKLKLWFDMQWYKSWHSIIISLSGDFKLPSSVKKYYFRGENIVILVNTLSCSQGQQI